MARQGWLCRCGYRNPLGTRKCRSEACNRSKPKKRRPEHEKALDNSYEAFEDFNARVHGPAFGPEWQPQNCGVCGKPPGDQHHDRDHGHRKSEHSYGRMRGLACPGNSGCNMRMKGLTLDFARLVVAYLERAEAENLRQKGVDEGAVSTGR